MDWYCLTRIDTFVWQVRTDEEDLRLEHTVLIENGMVIGREGIRKPRVGHRD